MDVFTIEPIGFIEGCFPEKFGIPRQPLLSPSSKATLTLVSPYNHPDMVEGLEQCSHLWLTFIFHQHTHKEWKSKVRPPRLGGNKKMGVFATRSSFRPNHLGLSVVKLEKIALEKGSVVLHLSGIDMLNGTPVVDIKPYLPYVDAVPEAINTFAEQPPAFVPIEFSEDAEIFIQSYKDKSLRQLLIDVLQQDPRPAYQEEDESRVYKMALWDLDIHWICKSKRVRKKFVQEKHVQKEQAQDDQPSKVIIVEAIKKGAE